MTRSLRRFVFALGMLLMTVPAVAAERSFRDDVAFLREHVETIVLGGDSDGPQVAVVPAYQGRVMTSTTGGKSQSSFGWINYEHIASGKNAPHINVFGGEERFWLGPEGGQFSIFFAPGAKFELADWQTPAVIDTEPFAVTAKSETSASFEHEATLTNYSGAKFKVRINRRIDLLSTSEAAKSLGHALSSDGLQMVGYRTTNRLTNTGQNDWCQDTGLLSIWLLGMYKPGERTTVVIPFHAGAEAELGSIVNDAYFGKPPAERLVLADDVLFFSGDGKHRSKIGLSPQRATEFAGSWDAEAGVLTILKYTKPATAAAGYVNSMWELQQNPFSGDVINSYNDGPPSPGAKPLGPFYELETSSPALALPAGRSAEHVQETYHFEGDRGDLDTLSKSLLGTNFKAIEKSLSK